MERDNLDVDMDQLMEMIDEMPEENAMSAFTTHESDIGHEPEEEASQPIREESKDAKIAFDAMNENLRLQQENSKLKAEKIEAERIAMHGVVRNFETQIEFENSDIGRLNRELIRARDEGDTAAGVDIEGKIRDKYERVRDLKGKVEQYIPYLSQAQARANEPEAPSGNQMASEWLRENSSWLQDDRFKDKREFADNIFKEMTSSGMNMNNVNFWTKMERHLTEFDSKKTQDKTQSRMPKNMVTYNSNNSNPQNTKKDSYKSNPEFLQKVAFLAKNVIQNEDILKNKELLNSTLRHYHKVYKQGGFKHMPLNAQG